MARELTTLEIHGMPCADLTTPFGNWVVASGRLGADSIPVDLEVGYACSFSG